MFVYEFCLQVLKQIWDISKYISFVFHQKSACQEVKPSKNNETDETTDEQRDDADEDYVEEDDPNDSDY